MRPASWTAKRYLAAAARAWVENSGGSSLTRILDEGERQRKGIIRCFRSHLLEEEFLKTRLDLVLVFCLLSAAARGDEGMWMPQQIPQLAERLKAMGFRGDPKAFADLTGQPMGAIVSLGGCSASFVSPDGLIVTNHHCVQGALQFNSTPQKNLMEDGFLATAREQELTAGPGSRGEVTTFGQEGPAQIPREGDPKPGERAG